MSIIMFLLLNWDSVLVVIGAAVVVVVLYKRGEVAILKNILFRLVTRAEQEYGGGTGELKKAAVIEWIYEKLPAVVRFIVTRKELDRLIDEVLEYAKSKWATNPRLQEIINSGPETNASGE